MPVIQDPPVCKLTENRWTEKLGTERLNVLSSLSVMRWKAVLTCVCACMSFKACCQVTAVCWSFNKKQRKLHHSVEKKQTVWVQKTFLKNSSMPDSRGQSTRSVVWRGTIWSFDRVNPPRMYTSIWWASAWVYTGPITYETINHSCLYMYVEQSKNNVNPFLFCLRQP